MEPGTSNTSRRSLGLWGALMLAAVLVFWPVLLGRTIVPVDTVTNWVPWTASTPIPAVNPLRSDVGVQMWPMRTLVHQRLLAGEAPLWSHELGTGQPLAGNAQSAPFSPFTLLALPFSPLVAISVGTLLAALVGAGFTAALALRLGAHPTAAALAGISFACSGWMAAWAGFPNAQVAVWLPALLLGLIDVRAGGTRRGILLLGLATAGAHSAGHPGTAMLVAVATGGAAVILGLWRPRRGWPVLVGVALGTLLALPATVPVLDVIPESSRAEGLRHVRPAAPAFAPRTLLGSIAPLAGGSPSGGTWTGTTPADRNFNEVASWSGAVPLCLAVAGALVGVRRTRLLLALAALALLVAAATPGLATVAAHVPGLRAAQIGRMTLYWTLALALGAAFTLSRLGPSSRALGVRQLGWLKKLVSGVGGRGSGVGSEAQVEHVGRTAPFQDKESSRPPDTRRLRATLAVVALVELTLLVVLGTGGGAREVRWLVVACGGLAALALACVLAARHPRVLVAVAVVATIFDLATLYHHLVPNFRAETSIPPLIAATVEAASAEGGRIVTEGAQMRPNVPAIFGLGDPRGNDPTRPFRVQRFLQGAGFKPGISGLTELPGIERVPPAVLEFLDVRWLITLDHRPPPQEWQLVKRDPGQTLWRQPGALGRFFVPARVRVPAQIQDTAELIQTSAELGDFSRRVLVEPGQGVETRPQRRSPIEVVLGSNRVDLSLTRTAAHPRVIASSVSWAPGWEVTGADPPSSARVLRVNGAFLGVAVPAGTREVSLRYRPRGWSWALVGSVLGALGLAAVGLSSRVNRPRHADSSTRQNLAG